MPSNPGSPDIHYHNNLAGSTPSFASSADINPPFPSSLPQQDTPPSESQSPTSTSSTPRNRRRRQKHTLVCCHEDCSNKFVVFERECDFRKHMRYHTRPVSCPFSSSGCEKRFPFNKGLNRHLWNHHPAYAEANAIPKVMATCPSCGRSMRTDNLQRHRQTCRRR